MKRYWKKMLAIFMILTLIAGFAPNISMREVKAAADVTMTVISASAQDSNARFLVRFDIGSTDTIPDYYWNNNTVYVDGEAKSGDGINYAPSETQLLLCLKYNVIEEGVTTASALGKHMIQIPAGTVLGSGTAGELVTTNDVWFYVSGSSITVKTPVNLSVSSAGNQSGSNRYLITLDVDGTEVTERFWNNNTAYVNGEAVSTGVNYSMKSASQLYLCLSYTAFGASSYTEVTDTVFEIRKGTLLGNSADCVINNDLVFYINGGSIVEKVPVTLSFSSAANQVASNRYLIYFDVSGASVASTDAVWSNNSAYINDVKTSTGVNYAMSSSSRIFMCLGYSAFGASSYTEISNARLEIRERTLMGTNYIIMNTLYFDVNGATVSASVPQEVVTLSDRATDGSTSGNGFYFVTSPTDSYPHDSSWGTNIYFSSGGVYVDGELKNKVYIRKILSNLYYVCLNDVGEAVSANQIVTIDGSIKNEDVKVVFTETSFIFTGSEWNVYTPPTEVDVNITGVDSGQQVDDVYHVYVSADTEIPEAVANNRFLFFVTIDGVEKSIFAYRVAGANQFLLVIETSKLQVKDYAVPIVIKATSGIETATIPMNIASDFTFYLYPDNKFYEQPEYATTLTLHAGLSSSSKLVLFTTEEAVCAAVNQIDLNSVFYPTTSSSGIWYNGKLLDESMGFELVYNETSQMNLCLTNLSAVSGDLLTVEGRFLNNGVLLNIAKANYYFNGTSWSAVTYSYEDVTEISMKEIHTAAEQTSQNRWLFRIAVDPALYQTSDFAGNYGTFFVNIYDGVNETPTTTSTYAYWAKDGMLGLVLSYDLLPSGSDAYNYEIVIPSFILKTGDYIYKFDGFRMKNIVGAWTRQHVYLTSINNWLGDANADEEVNSQDIVRTKKYLADEWSVRIYDGGTDANEDGKIDRKDVLKIYEYIFEGFYYEDGKNDSHPVKGVPYYADDQEIFTSAYQGPRAGGKNNYHYTPDTTNNYLYKDGLFSSKTLAGTLTTEYVETSFINEYEFQQYKDAGLTTLVSEGDVSWTNHDKFGMGGGMYAQMKYYMLLAQKVGLDVIVTSTGINVFVGDMNYTDCGYTTKTDGTELIYTKEYVVEDLTELVSFMNGENNLSQWGITETYVRESMGVPEEYVDAMVNQDVKFDNFVGIQLSDETDYVCVEKYNYVIEEMLKLKPDCKFHTSNLLTGRRDGSTDLTLETVMTGFSGLTKQFTFDEYMFRKQLSTKTVGLTEYGIVGDGYLGKDSASDVPWFSDHHRVAALASTNGYDTGVTLQSFGMYSSTANKVYDAPDCRGDMAWQVYTSLAYGIREIHYFTYWEHYTQATTGECHTGSMVIYPDDGSTRSVKTDLYGYVQSVNQEMQAYDHIFLDYDWKGTAYTGDNVGVGSGYVTSDDVTTDSALASWSSTETGMVSYMYDSEKQLDGFWVVNAENPYNNLTSTATLTFDEGYSRVLVFQGGKQKIVSLDNQALTLNLDVGEGVFVIAIEE